MPGAGSGSACARQAAVNESAGDERLVTDEEIVAVVVVVVMVGMVVACGQSSEMRAGMYSVGFPREMGREGFVYS